MTAAATPTFHPFPRLPFELRARIWELTVEPRVVEVRVVYHDPSPLKKTDPDAWTNEWMKKRLPPRRHLRSPTPVPVQLQTCREAREHLSRHPCGGYQRAFSEIMTTPSGGFDPVPEGDAERGHYVWLNLDVDMVSIGKTGLHDLQAVAHQVRRLRLWRDISCEYFSHTESALFGRWFTSLAEVRLICPYGMKSCYKVTEDIYFPCGPENVYLVDPEEMGGQMMSSADLDAMIDREWKEELGEPEEVG